MKKNFAYFAALGMTGIAMFSGCSFLDGVTDSPTADTILDAELFSSAANYRDVAKCDLLINKEKSEECKNIVDALLLTDSAVNYEDVSFCKKISLSRYKQACSSMVGSESERTKLMKEQERHAQNIADQASKFIREGNLEGCKTLPDENFRLMCEINIKASQ